MLSTDEQLDNYADLLIVQGLNVQPGQNVYIHGEVVHRDLLYRAAKAAYRHGAHYVGVDIVDPHLERLRLTSAKDKSSLEYVPAYITKKFDDLVDDQGAYLRIIGSEEPDLLLDLDANEVNTVQLSYRKAIKRFYQEGIGLSRVHWTIGSAATTNWAKKVLPHLSDEEALKELWRQLFIICRVDTPDYLKRWRRHDATLHRRAEKLTELKISELHFTGPGTDLRVGLSPKARFQGGSGTGPRGVFFEANVPTEECFTTPDWRRTEGHVTATRPFFINNQKVAGLVVHFKNGVITDFSATEGAKTYEQYISCDEGARRLGEVALVGIDSPIYQSGLLFGQTLLDENAACHIAIGFAYRFCLEGGTSMTQEELDALGCNTSHTHSDMMISSENVDVRALTYDGQDLLLIKEGRWAVSF